jgi:hypothetical protein
VNELVFESVHILASRVIYALVCFYKGKRVK